MTAPVSLGCCGFMFEPLLGHIDRVASACSAYRGLRFGFGGVARMDEMHSTWLMQCWLNMPVWVHKPLFCRTFNRVLDTSIINNNFFEQAAVSGATKKTNSNSRDAPVECMEKDRLQTDNTLIGLNWRNWPGLQQHHEKLTGALNRETVGLCKKVPLMCGIFGYWDVEAGAHLMT
jgi:hypothetical protein